MRSGSPRYHYPTVFADYFSEKLKIVTNNDDETQFGRPQSTHVDAADQSLVDDSLGNDNTPKSEILSPPCLPRSISSPTFANDDPLTLSPAAMFLSSFGSPKPLAPPPDSEGQTISGYVLGPVIGFGGFSTIRKAFSPGGGIAAVKVVRATDLSKQDNPTLVRRRLDHEAVIWSSLCHEHILPLFSSVHTTYADFFFTIFCPAGSLFDILKRDGRPALEQGDAGMMFRQVVRGLRYLHQEVGLVHRDLKLENILVDEMGVCKIGDFGMARKIGELDFDDQDEPIQDEPRLKHKRSGLSKRPVKQGLHAHLSLIRHQHGARHRSSLPANPSSVPTPTLVFQPGSLPYAAPELLSQRTITDPLRPHPAQDIWALGVLLYALMTGKLPFSDPFEPRLQMNILHGMRLSG
jgi:MAP/microtubule affinity-regulating kinase